MLVVGRGAQAVAVYLRDPRPELVRDPAPGRSLHHHPGTRIVIACIHDLVRAKAKLAGLDLRVMPHTLRHCCATHRALHVGQVVGRARARARAS